MMSSRHIDPPYGSTDDVRRLVFGDDGSATSDAVWEWISQHEWPGWTISVVTADDAPDVTILPPDKVPLVPWDPPHPRRLPGEHGEETRVEHLVGRADPRAVLDSAGSATLVVIGPRRHGVLHLLGVGSMAEWLLEHPDPPVAVIRRSHPTRRVLVYADGTRDAARALSCAVELPWLATCEVRVVALRGEGRYRAEAVPEAVARLRAAGADPIVQRVHAPAWLSTAERARVVLKEIEAFDPDLIAVGLEAHRSLARAFRAAGPTKSTWSVLVAVAGDGA